MHVCVCLLAFLVRDICSSSAPSLLRWRRGGIRPASGGSGGIGPASGGSGGKGLASGGVPAMYCWSFTKGEAGARVEMKGHLSSDLVAHDGVKRFTDMQLGFQLQMLLVREMPTDPSGHWDQIRWPLAAWRTEQSSSRTFSIAIEENTGSSKALTTFTGKPGKRGGRKVGKGDDGRWRQGKNQEKGKGKDDGRWRQEWNNTMVLTKHHLNF